MNRTQSRIPMSLLTTALFAVSLLLSSRTALAAPVTVGKTSYTLTYADGWMNPGLPFGDTTYYLMNTGFESAIAYGQGLQLGTAVSAATYSQYVIAAYTSHFAFTDSSTKTLGGYAFKTSGYRDTSASSDSTTRIRAYVTTKGSYLFVSWIIFPDTAEDAITSQEEAALATLVINVTTGIRSAPVSLAPELRNPGFDIQGRSRPKSGFWIPKVAVFRKL